MTSVSDQIAIAAPNEAAAAGSRSLIAPWAVYAVTAALATAFAVAVFRLPNYAYLGDLNIDDSFYYYQLSRNLAQGHFSTFDGINLTNGYHPLWPLILSPVFAAVHEPWLAVRVVKMVELAVLGAAALVLMAGGRRAGWPWLLALAVPLALFGTFVLYTGMETSIEVGLFAALFHGLVRQFEEPDEARWTRWITVVCCLLPWARLEMLSAGLAAMTIVSVHAAAQDRRRLRSWAIGWALVGASIAGYFAYNALVFGTAVPVSGAVKNYWSARLFSAGGGYNLLDNAKHYAWAHMGQAPVLLATVGVAAASWLFRQYREGKTAANKALDAFVIILAAAYVARLGYGIAKVQVAYDNDYYYVPILLLQAMAGPYVLSRLLLLWRLLSPRSPSPQWLPQAVSAAALAITAWGAHPWTLPGMWAQAQSPNGLRASLDGAIWMNGHLPPDAIVGSTDSGVLGYFCKCRVVNLDGLMNSVAFFRAVKAQGVETWIHDAKITHLANTVRADGSDGCAFIAAGSAQDRGYAGCRPRYEGQSFSVNWSGKMRPMQFRVYALDAARPGAPAP